MNYNICFFGDYWDDMWRRRQQLARAMAKTDIAGRVVYIERPLTVTSFLKWIAGRADRDAANRWKRVLSRRSWLMPVDEKLSVLTTFAPFPLISGRHLFRFSEHIRDKWLIRYLGKAGKTKKPLVWVSHPQVSVEFIKSLEPSILWYDCTEDFSAWPGLPAPVIEQIRSTDIWLTEHADVVTTVSSTLYNEKSRLNRRTYWLPNAVDIDLFMQPKENLPMPKELQDIQRPILTFVGGMCNWAHDWDLLDRVAALRPNWAIILIGNLSIASRTAKMLKAHGNILCLGQKPYSELPNYLVNSDICFLFYRTTRENDTRNSQKLFLYLAAGKPIVSTLSADIESYGDLVEIVNTAEEFVASAERLMASDSPGDALRRRESALENSWQRRVEQIRQILNDMDGRHDG